MDTKELTPKQKWEEYVENSNEGSAYLPEEFIDRAKELEAKREEFNELLAEVVSKTELELSVETNNLFADVRKYMFENGTKDIYMKSIGWAVEALKDDIFIINTWVQENRGR